MVIDYSPYRYGVGDWVHGFHATPLGNYDLSLETLTVSRTRRGSGLQAPGGLPRARPAPHPAVGHA